MLLVNSYNFKNKLINLVNQLIDFFILLTIGLVPIYFAFLYKDYSVFGLDKVILFRSLTEVLLLLYVTKIVLEGKIKITLKKWQIILPILFFLSYFLATIFSYSPHTSFWGHYWRHQGLFTYLHYFFFFLLVSLNYDFSQEKKQKRFLAILLLSSFIVCLFGFIQYIGLDWHKWQESQLLQRINSTLGQPNFLGAYLVLIIPLSVFSLFRFRNFYIKLLISIVLLFQFLILLLTYSRSAWLAILFICFLGIIYFFYFKQYKKILAVFISLLIIFCLLFLAVLFSGKVNYKLGSGLTLSARLQSFFSPELGSNKLRIDNYKLALSLINSKPILGYGPETMWLWFPHYYTKELSFHEKINTYFDRTHNEILDIIIFTGFIGLISFLLFLFYVLQISSKVLFRRENYEKDKNNFLFLFFTILGIIGYLVTLQFGFSITTTNIYFWTFLAIVFLLARKTSQPNYENKVIPISISSVIKYSFFFLFFLSIVFIIWQFNINKIIADIYFYKAMSGAVTKSNFKDTNDKFLKSLQYNPREDYYRSGFADRLIKTAKTLDDCEVKNKLLIPALSFLQDIPADRRDLNVRINLVRGKAFYFHCLEQDDFSTIDQAYQEVVDFVPELASLRLDGGEMYYQIGNYQKAIENFQNALELYPDIDDSRINQEHREQLKGEMLVVYKLLGDAYIKIENNNQALENYFKANELLGGQVNFDLRNKISEIYLLKKEYNKAIAFDQHSLTLSGNDIYYQYRLMQDYKMAGDLNNAKKYAEEVLKINEDIKEAKEILNL